MGSIGTSELLIILVLVLLVFGGTQLPKLARSLGQAQREFKSGISESESEAGSSEASRPPEGDKPSGGTSSNGAA